MKTTANIATMPGREKHLERTLKSIQNQFDIIRVVCNGFTALPSWSERFPDVIIHMNPDFDYTDNGKFWALDNLFDHEYYFTLDDDIIYPKNYAAKMLHALKRFNSIVTCHGRLLKGAGLNYYKDHVLYHCKREHNIYQFIDVCGTGVTAFDTRYFLPKGLATHPMKKMSDVVFSHACARANRKIVMIPRAYEWIQPQIVESSIWHDEHGGKQVNQIKLCDQILKLKSRN